MKIERKCNPATCENGKCRATGECIDIPESVVEELQAILDEHRDEIIEEVAQMLSDSYPDNANTNAFCAAIRSLKKGK